MTEKFYIYSVSHSPVNGQALWWGPNDSGYTTDINKAGIYTREQVESHLKHYDNGRETRAVPCALAKEIAASVSMVSNGHAQNWKERSFL